MKNILGLDLGTNSIGWAVVSKSDDGKYTQDIKLGSRIIPMSQDVLGKFDSGVTESQTAVRTSYRGMRRLRERCLLRRERLHRVLDVMNFLPEHYDNALGWNKNQNSTYGKFLNHGEPKLAWRKDETGKMQFLFMDSFNEMLADFAKHQPGLLAGDKKIPLDWTLYYLRKKALTQPISKQELAWIILNFNQKRGYYQLRGEEEEQEKKNKL
jgi:CRISPR-associated endonuclease Csn1